MGRKQRLRIQICQDEQLHGGDCEVPLHPTPKENREHASPDKVNNYALSALLSRACTQQNSRAGLFTVYAARVRDPHVCLVPWHVSFSLWHSGILEGNRPCQGVSLS